MAGKIDLEKFFEHEWRSRYIEKIPCEDTEDGCGDNEEGTLIDGYMFANRLLIWILNYREIAFFRQKDWESYVPFELEKDIFKCAGYDLVPKLADSLLYPDDVVIFSEGKELLVSDKMNIGEVIDRVIKEQERLLIAKQNIPA